MMVDLKIPLSLLHDLEELLGDCQQQLLESGLDKLKDQDLLSSARLIHRYVSLRLSESGPWIKVGRPFEEFKVSIFCECCNQRVGYSRELQSILCDQCERIGQRRGKPSLVKAFEDEHD